MDDAILAKKIMSDFQSKANPLKDAIRKSKEVIAETGLKLGDDTLTEPQKAAYRLDIVTHTKKLIESQKSLDFHSDHTAKSVNPLLNNIARFTKTLEDTYANEEARLAQIKIDSIADRVKPTRDPITDKIMRERIDAVESNQFMGDPFRDYVADKKLPEGKN